MITIIAGRTVATTVTGVRSFRFRNGEVPSTVVAEAARRWEMTISAMVLQMKKAMANTRQPMMITMLSGMSTEEDEAAGPVVADVAIPVTGTDLPHRAECNFLK